MGFALALACIMAVVYQGHCYSNCTKRRLPHPIWINDNMISQNSGPLQVVNGELVAEAEAFKEFPWMSFQSSAAEGGPFCGGTLINESWVLTAAHCLYSTHAAELKVSVDVRRYNYTKRAAAEGGQERSIDRYYAHPHYDAKQISNDIALLHLSKPVSSAEVEPVSLDWEGTATEGTPVLLIGWGSLDVACKDYGSKLLHKAALSIPSHATCTTAAGGGYNAAKQMCAGQHHGDNKWTEAGCGDSGGPLLYKGPGGQWIQTGIVSWGYGHDYDIYTRVAGYKEWVLGCMHDESACRG